MVGLFRPHLYLGQCVHAQRYEHRGGCRLVFVFSTSSSFRIESVPISRTNILMYHRTNTTDYLHWSHFWFYDFAKFGSSALSLKVYHQVFSLLSVCCCCWCCCCCLRESLVTIWDVWWTCDETKIVRQSNWFKQTQSKRTFLPPKSISNFPMRLRLPLLSVARPPPFHFQIQIQDQTDYWRIILSRLRLPPFSFVQSISSEVYRKVSSGLIKKFVDVQSYAVIKKVIK